MKKLLVLTMSVIMVLSLAACGGGGSDSESGGGGIGGEKTINVTLSIDYPDEYGIEDIVDLDVEIIKRGTVLAALNAYADNSRCDVIMSGSDDTSYISSIGGVAETDEAGWVYEVNDEEVMKAADECVLKDGDKVSWSFESWGE